MKRRYISISEPKSLSDGRRIEASRTNSGFEEGCFFFQLCGRDFDCRKCRFCLPEV